MWPGQEGPQQALRERTEPGPVGGHRATRAGTLTLHGHGQDTGCAQVPGLQQRQQLPLE